MGPVSKGAVHSVLGAVPLGVCLMDADSSFVVAQVIPPLCVSSSSMQEGTPEEGRRGGTDRIQLAEGTLLREDAAVDTIFANSAPSPMLPTLQRTPKPVTTKDVRGKLPKRKLDY